MLCLCLHMLFHSWDNVASFSLCWAGYGGCSAALLGWLAVWAEAENLRLEVREKLKQHDETLIHNGIKIVSNP